MQSYDEARYLSGARRLFEPNKTAVEDFLQVHGGPGTTHSS